jgi:DNA-binding CsgD family transcriptional regulator
MDALSEDQLTEIRRRVGSLNSEQLDVISHIDKETRDEVIKIARVNPSFYPRFLGTIATKLGISSAVKEAEYSRIFDALYKIFDNPEYRPSPEVVKILVNALGMTKDKALAAQKDSEAPVLNPLITEKGDLTAEALERVLKNIQALVSDGTLTAQEQEILDLVVEGKPFADIAETVGLSSRSAVTATVTGIREKIQLPKVNVASASHNNLKNAENLKAVWVEYKKRKSEQGQSLGNSVNESVRKYLQGVGYHAARLGLDPYTLDVDVLKHERVQRAAAVGLGEEATWFEVFCGELAAGKEPEVPVYCDCSVYPSWEDRPEDAIDISKRAAQIFLKQIRAEQAL